jgi:hypothetical protein
MLRGVLFANYLSCLRVHICSDDEIRGSRRAMRGTGMISSEGKTLSIPSQFVHRKLTDSCLQTPKCDAKVRFNDTTLFKLEQDGTSGRDETHF